MFGTTEKVDCGEIRSIQNGFFSFWATFDHKHISMEDRLEVINKNNETKIPFEFCASASETYETEGVLDRAFTSASADFVTN